MMRWNAMKSVVISVYDAKGEMFGRPYFVRTQGEGMRSFLDEVNRVAEDNQFYKHPEDFMLYHIADYDDTTGSFSNVVPPKMLTSGSAGILTGIENKISKV